MDLHDLQIRFPGPSLWNVFGHDKQRRGVKTTSGRSFVIDLVFGLGALAMSQPPDPACRDESFDGAHHFRAAFEAVVDDAC